jgi:hypothetical protein
MPPATACCSGRIVHGEEDCINPARDEYMDGAVKSNNHRRPAAFAYSADYSVGIVPEPDDEQ